MTALLSRLADILGPANVLVPGQHDLMPFEKDWRGRARGKACAVLRPGSTQEVSAVLAAVHHAKQQQGLRLSIVPQGGNTGLVMGSTPDDSGTQMVLSLSRMNRIRAMDAANASMTVDAGCVLQNLQQAADDAALLFPLSLAAEGSCQIGGNLATNAGGTQVLRYGNTRDLCLGLEVVLADGQIIHGLSGLRKDNTGYDLRHLMIGSEGTLGIITAATLKLFPKPAARITAWACLPSLQAAVQLLNLAQSTLASGLTGFEVMGQFAVSLVVREFAQQRVPLWPGSSEQAAYCVLLENSDFENEAHARARFEALLERAFEQNIVSDAVIAENIAQSKALWHVRESIPLAQAQLGLNIKHDISLPVSNIAAFCAETDALLQSLVPDAQLVNFGHLGDGNLHYNLQCPQGAEPQAFLAEHEARINDAVYAQVQKFAGSISAEHGIGSLKRDKLAATKDSASLFAMRAIKNALDPLNLLNPGRVL
jgi:FAD/FMN-containing dehydrogenase